MMKNKSKTNKSKTNKSKTNKSKTNKSKTNKGKHINRILIGGESKKVLVMCQRKTGLMSRLRTDTVEDIVIPKINLLISHLFGNDDISIVYLSHINSQEGTVDINCNLNGITQCSKDFIAKNRNSFDLIILQTCPFSVMNYHILHSLLKPNGILGTTGLPDEMMFREQNFSYLEYLIPFIPNDLFELETSDDFYISQHILLFRKI